MSETTDSGVNNHAATSKNMPTVERPGAEGNSASAAGEVAQFYRRSGPRLLVVDDRPELLKSLSEVVRLHGYQVTEALGGKAALEMLATDEFDVVLLDLIMPDVSGHDVLDFASARKLSAKFIVVSGDASFDGVKRALTRGAFDFVKKAPRTGRTDRDAREGAAATGDSNAATSLMEERLKESEELHRFIVNNSPDLVYMLDRNGCFEFLNDRVETPARAIRRKS